MHEEHESWYFEHAYADVQAYGSTTLPCRNAHPWRYSLSLGSIVFRINIPLSPDANGARILLEDACTTLVRCSQLTLHAAFDSRARLHWLQWTWLQMSGSTRAQTSNFSRICQKSLSADIRFLQRVSFAERSAPERLTAPFATPHDTNGNTVCQSYIR